MENNTNNNKRYPGNRVDYQQMKVYLNRMLSNLDTSFFHYALTLPKFPRQVDNNYTIRICHFDNVPKKLTIQAAFEGIVGNRIFSTNDIFVGSYNSGNTVINMPQSSYSGFSLIFQLQNIRLHYVIVENGEIKENIYFHSNNPANFTIQMLLNALDSIIHERTNKSERCRSLLKVIILQVIQELDIESQSNAPSFDPMALKIKDYLDSNFQRDINCSNVAELLNINRSYASTVFKQNFNISMNTYLLTLRLETAKVLLRGKNDLKIKEISELCALGDVGYFIKVFKKNFGVTPSEFRQEKRLN
jgi:AraC-like DNA-binding protein